MSIQHRHHIPLSGSTRHLSASVDAKLVAVVEDSDVRVFENSREVASWPCPMGVSDISLSADGIRLVLVNDSPDITVHEVRTGKVLSTLNRDGAPDFLRNDKQVHAALYPDAKTLVSTGAKQRLYVSDVETGRWQYIMFMKHRGARCEVSSTGQHVVLFGKPNPSELSGHVSVFAVNHGLQPLWNKSHSTEDEVTWAAFRRDGKQLATGADDGVRIWTTIDGELVHHLPWTSDEPAVGARFIGRFHLLTATPDKLNLINLTDGQTVETKGSKDRILALGCSIDGTAVVTQSPNAINYWTITPIESGAEQ